MFSKFLLLFSASLLITIFASDCCFSADKTIAYKLAVIHTRGKISTDVRQSRPAKPAQSVIAEFDLLLSSLQNRCTNPETTIADTMVETWQILKQNGRNTSLLETAHQLNAAARNTVLFGYNKVNFRLTSKVWLTAILANTSMEEALKAGTQQPANPK